MKLVVTEKPSVAKTYAAALGITCRRDGYFEGKDYLVSWCIGHLAGLADAEIYDSRFKQWELSQLPIIPEPWRLVVSPDKQKQFRVLKELMARPDISTVINACDAGREGELIFRNVFRLSGCKKPIQRLWLSSMEESAIRDGFTRLREGTEYERLYQAALCRAKADWLVGINMTRFFTLLYHRKLKVGRVMSPTLSMLVQRESELRSFVPEPFFTVQLDLGGFSAVSARFSSKADAASILGDCAGKAVQVRSVEQVKKVESPPALFDLTSLQREANKALGFTAQQTLDYAQSLYEKKLCTYPRTDSRYLTDDMEARVPDYISVSSEICDLPLPLTMNAKQVCDSSKVSDHFAIIPTLSCKSSQLEGLPSGELQLLKLIALGVLRAVSESHVYIETVATFDSAGRPFSAKGKTVIESGWKRYLSQEKEAPSLPALTEGQALSILSSALKEGQTSAPPRYTEASLLAAMESAGKEDIPNSAERRGIGTPATRAGIIEKLVDGGYILRKKSKKATHLVPSDIGMSLISVLPKQLRSPILTAEWEQQLQDVEQGSLSPVQFEAEIAAFISDLIQDYKPDEGSDLLFSDSKAVIGKCPRCGFPVVEREKGFFCENRDCRFALWKDNKYFTAKRKKITCELAEALLNEGKAFLKSCYSEKTGKSYDATVLLEDDGERTSFRLVFS